jgi:succinate-semialdehyde dehydrogenase/glutarate-semialdehyde dehydrogenase
MDRHIADAVGQGAVLRAGGHRVPGHPTDLYYAPTVLDHVPTSAAVIREETFGPIAPLVRVPDEAALLELANHGDTGLVASVFTRSLDRAWRFAERLETGSVVINDSSNYWELHLPFGGRAGRTSGRGRVGGRYAVEEFTQTKTVSFHIG